MLRIIQNKDDKEVVDIYLNDEYIGMADKGWSFTNGNHWEVNILVKGKNTVTTVGKSRFKKDIIDEVTKYMQCQSEKLKKYEEQHLDIHNAMQVIKSGYAYDLLSKELADLSYKLDNANKTYYEGAE